MLEKLSEQVAEIEGQVQAMKEKVKEDYCELPTDLGQARIKLQQLRDEIKYKEEVLKKKMA